MKKFALSFLYVFSIVLAVGIGMTQAVTTGDSIGSVPCNVAIISPSPCTGGVGCSGEYITSTGGRVMYANFAPKCEVISKKEKDDEGNPVVLCPVSSSVSKADSECTK